MPRRLDHLPPAARERVDRLRSSWRAGRERALRHRVVTVREGPAQGMRIGLGYASNEYRDGRIEMPVQRAIANLMHPGCAFFDIGANVGFFTLVAAAAVDGDATLVAFEPRRDVAQALEANLSRNDIQATVWPVAVGEREGIAPLLVAEHPGGATIEPSKAYDTRRIEHVPQVCIDDLVESGRLPVPDVVKLDVEGAEPAVLTGMARTLRRGQTTIVYEVDAPTEDLVEQYFAEIDGLLTGLGYSSRRLDPSYEGSGWHVIHAVASPDAGGSTEQR